jgi:hypothetical protein
MENVSSYALDGARNGRYPGRVAGSSRNKVFESDLCKLMKTYYRGCILTLTTAGGLLSAGCGLDSNTSETLAQHPRLDLLCLAEISAAESVFRPEPETNPKPNPAPTPIPSDDWARQWPKA